MILCQWLLSVLVPVLMVQVLVMLFMLYVPKSGCPRFVRRNAWYLCVFVLVGIPINVVMIALCCIIYRMPHL